MKFAASGLRGARWRFNSSFTALLLLSLAIRCPAGEIRSVNDALQQLADRVATIPNFHGPVQLKFDGPGNFARHGAVDWKDAFHAALEQRKISATKDEQAPIVRVVAAETPAQMVFTAATLVGDREEVRMICLARAALRAETEPVAQMRIEKQFLYESGERILDAAPAASESDGGLLILSYRDSGPVLLRMDAGGETKQMISFSASNAHLSRDPRGHLALSERGGEVFLNGKSCEFSWKEGDSVKCRPAKTNLPESVVLAPACQSSEWRLETIGRDWSGPDTLQMIPEGSLEGEAALVSEFPGPVLKVHGGENRENAFIVAKNLKTGNYEVYQITLACGR